MKTTKNKINNSPTPLFKRFRFAAIFAAIAIVAIGIVAAVSAQKGKVTPEKVISVARPTKESITKQAAPIDPQTGLIRPLTREEAQKMADGIKQLVNDTDEGLVQVQQPDGSVTVDLQGHYQNLAVAKKNADGTVSESCINNTEAAASFFGIAPEQFGDAPKSSSLKIVSNGQGEIK